jgi:hypothetical protein
VCLGWSWQNLSLPCTQTKILHKGCLIIHSQHTFNLSTSKYPLPSILFCSLRFKGTQPLQMARTRQAKAAASEAESAPQRPKITRQSKAAAPETKSVSQRSKITRQSRAAASETESASQSPKVARQSKAAASKTESVDFNNEDYNIRSPKRTKLLTEIKGVFNNAPVSPALWACCQLADMDCLQVITKLNKAMIRAYENSLATIAMKCGLLGF